MNEAGERQGAALNPVTHAILMPLFTVSAGVAIYLASHTHGGNALVYGWLGALSFALILLNMQTRLYALRVQDRVIRLEETLRYQRLLGPEGVQAAQTLSLRQMIALRFASDAELPELARRASVEGLTPQAIKAAVQVWRVDSSRV